MLRHIECGSVQTMWNPAEERGSDPPLRKRGRGDGGHPAEELGSDPPLRKLGRGDGRHLAEQLGSDPSLQKVSVVFRIRSLWFGFLKI